MIFVGYKKCNTSNKAEKWLKDKGLVYVFRDIKTENPSVDELKHWKEISSLEIRKLFNTSGLLYKELDLKTKLPLMSDEEMLILLASDGMLVKRPILITGDKALFGFSEKEYSLLNR